ncbi:hypothetical protein ES708_26545 [subsurface metagenome]
MGSMLVNKIQPVRPLGYNIATRQLAQYSQNGQRSGRSLGKYRRLARRTGCRWRPHYLPRLQNWYMRRSYFLNPEHRHLFCQSPPNRLLDSTKDDTLILKFYLCLGGMNINI